MQIWSLSWSCGRPADTSNDRGSVTAWNALPTVGYHSIYTMAFAGTFICGNTAGRSKSYMAALIEAVNHQREPVFNTQNNGAGNNNVQYADRVFVRPQNLVPPGPSTISPSVSSPPSGTPPTDKLKHKLANRISVNRHSIFEVLRELALENANFFDNSGWFFQTYQTRYANCCRQIYELAAETEKYVKKMQSEAPRFDYDPLTPGNGYRSIVCVTDTCILQLVRLLRHVRNTRQSLVFRSSHHCKELESYVDVLKFLTHSMTGICGLLNNPSKTKPDNLFPLHDPEFASRQIALMRSIEHMDNACFYGRAMGFQFPPSIGRVFHFIGIVLATYSVRWEKGTTWSSLFDSGKLMLSPERRARRIIKVTREADISFCKGFWNMSEEGLYYHLPQLLTRSSMLSYNEVVSVPVDGPLYLKHKNGSRITIPVPSAHTGVRPVLCRLLAANVRKGMTPSATTAPSDCLLFHCHGGGFVATSSKSHETYLRHWARSLDCPVFSVDYSLAPDDPYPRPTEEVIYAYAWVLANAHKLGWTGKRIVCVGDSAGGNLITSLITRSITLGVKRMPDGVVLVYTPFIFQYLPSPSRLLHMMDPLLHMGIVMRCIMAYTGQLLNVDPDALANNSASNMLDALDYDANDQHTKQHAKAKRRASLGDNGHKSLQCCHCQRSKKTVDELGDTTDSDEFQSLSESEIPVEEYCSELMAAQRRTSPLVGPPGRVMNMLNLDLTGGSRDNCLTEVNESSDDLFHTPEENMTPASTNGALFHLANDEHEDDMSAAHDHSDLADATADSGCPTSPPMSGHVVRQKNSSRQPEDGVSTTVVEIHNDVNRIWLHSAVSGDEDFVEYLSEHPLTKQSLQRTDNCSPTPSDDGAPSSPLQTPFASFSDLTTAPDSPTYARTVIPVSQSVQCMPSKRTLDRTPGVDNAEPSSPTSGGVAVNLKRNRSLSQSVSDTLYKMSSPVALATAHVYDNLTGLMEAAVPEKSEDQKKPLTRADPFSQSYHGDLRQSATEAGASATPVVEDDAYELMFKRLLNEPVSREPELSAMYASDEMLRQWPATYFAAGHLDPLLDDTVAFARHMRDVGGNVQGVDLLDSLPHGFLNFTLLSPECRYGAKVVLNRIRQAFAGTENEPTRRPVVRTP